MEQKYYLCCYRVSTSYVNVFNHDNIEFSDLEESSMNGVKADRCEHP